MSDVMRQKKLDQYEATFWRYAWDDGFMPRANKIAEPGWDHPNGGTEKFAWKPDEWLGNYIPYGGMMQEKANRLKAE